MTSRTRSWLAVFSLGALGVSPQTMRAQVPHPTPPSGFWKIGFVQGQDTAWARLTLRFERDSVIGVHPEGFPMHGGLRGDSLHLSFTRSDNGAHVVFAGLLRSDTLRGTRVATLPGASAPLPPGVIFATPDVPSRTPRRLTFEPKVFYRAFSGVAPAALRIVPGDTVRTWSVDNAGRDSTGASLTPGGNPLTGPFFVEGAFPGDVIAVRLHRVRLNRDWAQAGTQVAWNVLTPWYVRSLKEAPGTSGRWHLDRARGLAMPETPTPSLRSFAVPARPMLGCIGVAPWNGQVIQAQDSGPYGGNMDYNGIREGTTVYLPVLQRGALLFVGDGHAVQGDGELTGDALETSMDIEFSVELLRQHWITTPRAEDDEFLMAIGVSGDLVDAVRRATTELSRWLEADYRLSAPEVASLLGVSMRYDVGNLVDTQVSIVAKMPKAALRQLERPAK
jgi:acetamidase/formamidase